MTRCHEKPGIFPDGISGLTQRRKRKAETFGYISLAEFSHTKIGMVKDVDGKYFKHNNKNKNKKQKAFSAWIPVLISKYGTRDFLLCHLR